MVRSLRSVSNDMPGRKESTQRGTGFLIAGILSAIGASICCVGPLVLLAVGVSGAWIGSLTALEPYRPLFVGLTLWFLGLAFYRIYLARPACSPESACANPRALKRQRLAFWIVAAVVLASSLYPGLPHCFIDCEITHEWFCSKQCYHCTSFHPICWSFANRHSRCAEYDLCGLSDHSQESASESAWGNGRESGFR